jgi:hypothetical protein
MGSVTRVVAELAKAAVASNKMDRRWVAGRTGGDNWRNPMLLNR